MADSKDEDFCQSKGELDMSESSDVSCSTEDLLDELGSTTPRSDCDSLDSSFKGSRYKEFRKSILDNEDNLKRFLETSDEDTQDNILFLRKLNYIADKTREILLYVKSVKDQTELIGSEMKKQDGNLEMKNYLDDKWCKASAAYRSMHNTITGMKDMTTKIHDFVNVSISDFEQRLSKHVIENMTTDQALDKQYAEIWKLRDELREVADRVKNMEELHKSFLSHISVISLQMKESNECQQDIKSTLHHIKKGLEMSNGQQHCLPIKSRPTSPYVPYNSNVSAVPIKKGLEMSNSQQHYLPIKSRPTSPYVPYNSNVPVVPIKKGLEMSNDQQHYPPIKSCPTSPYVPYNSNVSAVPVKKGLEMSNSQQHYLPIKSRPTSPYVPYNSNVPVVPIKKGLEMSNDQQHYPPIKSCPTSPYVPYNSNVPVVPLNNSFHHASPSLLRVEENCFGDIRFINKRKLCSKDRLFQKPFSGKLLKENTPPFLVKLEPVEKDTEVTGKGCNNVRKGDLFDDILRDYKPEIDKSQIPCKEDEEVPLPASNDSKTESKKARIKLESAVPVSELTVINVNKKANASELSNIMNNLTCLANKQAKPKAFNSKEDKKCPNANYIYDEKSIPTVIAPFSAVSIGKRPLGQQNKDCEKKEQYSKKNGSISTPALEVYEIDDDDDEVIFIENVVNKPSMHPKNVAVSKGNAMSEENVTSMQQKSRAASTRKKCVNNEQPSRKDNSNGKVVSQEVTPSSVSKVPLVQEKRGCRSRKRDLKKNVLKALSVNDNDTSLAKIPRNVPLQSNQEVLMPGEYATVPNTPNNPSISGERGPYQFRTKEPHSKRIKTESSNEL